MQTYESAWQAVIRIKKYCAEVDPPLVDYISSILDLEVWDSLPKDVLLLSIQGMLYERPHNFASDDSEPMDLDDARCYLFRLYNSEPLLHKSA